MTPASRASSGQKTRRRTVLSSLGVGLLALLALRIWVQRHGYFPSEGSLLELVDGRGLFPSLVNIVSQTGCSLEDCAISASAVFASGIFPAAVYASGSLTAGLLGGGLLFICAGGALFHEVAAGSSVALPLFLALLAIGLMRTRRAMTAGILCGLIAWSAPGGAVSGVALLLLQALTAERRELARFAAGFFIILVPWLYHSWNSVLACLRSPLEIAFASTRWFPDTDSGFGHLVITKGFEVYRELVRTLWAEWSKGWLNAYFSEIVVPALLLFASVSTGVRYSEIRRASWSFALLAIFCISTLALWPTERGQLLILDGFFALWLGSLVRLGRGPWKLGAIALILISLSTNLPQAWHAVMDLRPEANQLEGRVREVTEKLRQLNPAMNPVLSTRREAAGLAFLNRDLPVFALPENFREGGIADAFIDRFEIHWTTAGELLAPFLRKYSLRKAAETGIWEIRRN